MNGTKDFSQEEKALLDKTIQQIDNSIGGETDRNMTVYRGMPYDRSDLPVGTELPNKGFTSTSAVKDIAQGYAEYDAMTYGHGVMVEIRVPKGTKALGIGFNSKVGDEGEVLFGRNAIIKIIQNNADGVIGEIYYGKEK